MKIKNWRLFESKDDEELDSILKGFSQKPKEDKEELYWINQVFSEIKDHFTDTPGDFISFTNFDTNHDYFHGMQKFKTQGKIFGSITCYVSLFPEVRNEIDRIEEMLKDEGYELVVTTSSMPNVYIGRAGTRQRDTIVGRFYTLIMEVRKEKSREKRTIPYFRGIIPETYIDESNSHDDGDPKEIEWFKQIFADITDILPGCMTEIEFIPFIVNHGKEIIRYETSIECGIENSEFIEEELEVIKEILKDDGYTLTYHSQYKYIARHIVTRMARNIKDFKQYHISIQKIGGQAHKEFFDKMDKERNLIKESNLLESHLLIVDIQKSFHKYFTEKYVHEVKNYAKQFNNVYQIWDNHVDGKDVDKDFLYDKNPDVPVHDDLYHFDNQKELIEKRYNYKVTADYYKKILDRETRRKIKETQLKKGDFFLTKENTIIVFVQNNHRWFHVPKKLYELFKKLKGKDLTVVGGSDNECLEDVVTAGIALGVNMKRDHRYIYSASHCPIK